MLRRSLFVVALSALFTAGLAFAQTGSNDPFVGTWKLNVAKSKFSPGPPPKSETVTISPDGKTAVHAEGADGKNVDWSYTAVEGGSAPIEGQGPGATVVSKHVNSNTIEHTWKNGTSTETGRAVLSKDGKTMRYTLKGTNAQGQPVHELLVFEKEQS